MIYKINVTVDAERDLDDIYNDITEHFLSLQFAQKPYKLFDLLSIILLKFLKSGLMYHVD